MTLNIREILIELIFLSLAHYTSSQVIARNEESDGISIKSINDTIHDALSKTEFLDNVIRIASWNIYEDPINNRWENVREDVCDAIRRISPMVFGLQEVRKDQIEYLRKCLPVYKVIAAPTTSSEASLYTPIFYRTDLRQLRFVRSGTFWLSKAVLAKLTGSKLEAAQRARVCTWTHMRFATRLTRYPLPRSSHVYRNFMWLRQVIGLPKRVKTKRRRTKWRWKDVIVANTDLDSNNPAVAKQQLQFLFDYLYTKEIGPRDYPVILTGDLKWEGSADVFQAVKNAGGLDNAMESSRVTYPGALDKDDANANAVDYIYHRKLTGVLGATINDERPASISYSPVFSAFVFDNSKQ